ncbi:MAG: PAS domain S-box protein [Hyphomicrobium sp.]
MAQPKLDEFGGCVTPATAAVFDTVSATDPVPGLRLLASSPDCVKLLDVDGRLKFMNENGLGLLEIDSFNSLDNRKWVEFWPDDLRPAVEKAIQEARSGTIGHFSGYCPTAKGTPKWWDVKLSPVYDNSGQLIWLLCVSRDVSSQKEAENALRVSEERFRALADNIAQFAWMADPTGQIVWYNQRWFDFTGTTLDEMKGWGWRSVHHPDHIDRVVAKFTACIEDGTVWEDTFPLRGANGEYRWFLSRAMPIRDDSGKIAHWCGTNTDITEQRSASERLRQLARLVELSHEAIIVRSLSKGVMLWNRGCVELYGYTKDEVIGRDAHVLLKTENALSREDLEHLLQSDGTWSGELARTSKDGTRVWVDSRKQVIQLGSEFVVLESDRDITERHRADEVRNLLVAELHHRVKNTLAIVQSLASQTARNSRTVADFVAGFSGRLQSLASAHNVLTDTNWSGALIRDVVRVQIEVIAGDMTKVDLSGPHIYVPPQAALQLTLILHELATNATKHGALSQPGGRIGVTWQHVPGNTDEVRLVWRELGGPRVEKPSRQGFGLSLIERSGRLPHLNANMTFEDSGVVCTVVVKLSEKTQIPQPYFNPARKVDRF